ncbi:hypothetical protein F0Q45_19505 [Mycobacterium simiae]|uniref:Uncharacterized protein n=1 Tax=Mycobacterium simiae TaxID=1784 RepID=A0A5B1BMH0_MYCSI|nr:hypothetical protein [Mycobacterium simiae]KAA1248640.1 hypothetical protein F0Q45_19505 [Mycobacterium simiae]
MANRLDVAGRLAEGRLAVERTRSYVHACQQVGYHHPDLTLRPGQLSDWYDGEEGLDLHALDSDCALLRAAGTAVAEALGSQRVQVTQLAAAWTGPGAEAAVGFLQRHCDAANELVTEVRAAAQRCESLRDNLWQLVDSKVESAIAIDNRTLAQRPAWLTAAETVKNGMGDRPAAEQVLRDQVTPYVDNDIRIDWLTAMRSTRAGVAASYDLATDRLAGTPQTHFEVPGDLGPRCCSVAREVPNAPQATAAAAPAASVPDAMPPGPAPAASVGAPVTPAALIPPPTPSDLGVGSGAGGLGGLGGLANRIVDAMVDLLGAAGDGLSDPVRPEDSLEPEGPVDADLGEAHDDGPPQAEPVEDMTVADPGDQPQPSEAGERAAAAIPPVAPQQPAGAAPPSPAGGPPAVGPLPAPAPTRASTPCEIAADQLPKAGQ